MVVNLKGFRLSLAVATEMALGAQSLNEIGGVGTRLWSQNVGIVIVGRLSLRGVRDPAFENALSDESVVLQDACGGAIVEGTGCPDALERWVAPKVRYEQAYSGRGISVVLVTTVDNVTNQRAVAVDERLYGADYACAFGHDNVKC